MRPETLAAIKRFISLKLDSSDLTVQKICQHSGWSRSTVYRLFESEGGLVNYIEQRRLHRAFGELVSGVAPRRRILDIALESQFASEATFSRAFRRTFGLPPGKARALCGRAPEQHTFAR